MPRAVKARAGFRIRWSSSRGSITPRRRGGFQTRPYNHIPTVSEPYRRLNGPGGSRLYKSGLPPGTGPAAGVTRRPRGLSLPYCALSLRGRFAGKPARSGLAESRVCAKWIFYDSGSLRGLCFNSRQYLIVVERRGALASFSGLCGLSRLGAVLFVVQPAVALGQAEPEAASGGRIASELLQQADNCLLGWPAGFPSRPAGLADWLPA